MADPRNIGPSPDCPAIAPLGEQTATLTPPTLGCSNMTLLATWYRREDYDLMLTIMDDASEFPETFEEWERTALRQVASMGNRGADVKQVIIDPDKFVIFCKKKGLSKDGKARAEYLASMVAPVKNPDKRKRRK